MVLRGGQVPCADGSAEALTVLTDAFRAALAEGKYMSGRRQGRLPMRNCAGLSVLL